LSWLIDCNPDTSFLTSTKVLLCWMKGSPLYLMSGGLEFKSRSHLDSSVANGLSRCASQLQAI